jgi:hypothetical protein
VERPPVALTVLVHAHGSVEIKATGKVKVMARHLPPILGCSVCEGPAKWAHSWEDDEATVNPLLYCGRHGKTTRDEQVPVVNSPRMGFRAYEGGNDESWPPAAPKLAFEPKPTKAAVKQTDGS